MLASLVAAVVISQGQAAQEQMQPVHPGETAVQIVQKVLARYSEANSISGIINMVQSAGNVEVKIDTQLQFQKPSKIFLRQIKVGRQERLDWLLVSDGKVFSYDRPSGVHGRDRFKELVTQHSYTQTIRDMYTVQRFSLSDPSPMLDVAIGRKDDLKTLMGQWSSMKVHSSTKANGQDTTAIVGSFVEKPGEKPNGTFEAYFNKEYDFVRYVQKQRYTIQIDKQGPQTIDVVTIWNSSLKVNAEPNSGLFIVSN